MQNFDTKVRLNVKRINQVQKMKAMTGKGKQELIDAAWDEYFARHSNEPRQL